MGARVEIATADFEVTDPLLDVELVDGLVSVVADRDRAILRVTGVGTFAISDGNRICLELEEAAPANAVSTWLHGTVAAFLLAQRGSFALHASVVEIDGVAAAVAGPPESGKSTTALRLLQRGHTLVVDDVSPLDARPPVTVQPFTRPLHVWPETAAALGYEPTETWPMLPNYRKLAVPMAPSAAVPVAAIAVLNASSMTSTVRAVRARGALAHSLLAVNIYRVWLLSRLLRAEMFAWAAAIAANVAVYEVSRPSDGWTVDAVADAVERIAANHRDGR